MRRRTQQSYKERTLKVLVHIQQRLDDDLSLSELARIAGFSDFHFHRIFRGIVGESVKEHVRRLRMERAGFRLIHTDQPVTSIAFDAGYETHESFTRSFRKMFNCTPSQFRAQHQNAWYTESPSNIHFVPTGELSETDFAELDRTTIEVRIATIPKQTVAFIRHVGPYLDAGDTWRELLSWARNNRIASTKWRSGICYDDPMITQASKLRYDACISLDHVVEPNGSVAIQDLFGGEFAIFTHRGPYDQLAAVHEMLLGQWLPSSGREVRDAPCIEIYRRSPFDTGETQDLKTEVCVPLVADSD